MNSDEMEMTLERELDLPVGEPTQGRLAITGEDYATFCGDRQKKEGEEIAVWCTGESAAWDIFVKAVKQYKDDVIFASHGAPTLYWRTKPEFCTRVVLEKQPRQGPETWIEVTLYAVYARLLISMQPALEGAA